MEEEGESTDVDGPFGVKRMANDGKAIDQAVKTLITVQIRAPFYCVEEGIINLLKQCLIFNQQEMSMSAVSGHVDHFESVHDDDFGWGCGWRNIQILCSFLLSQGSDVKEALFHGVGFVPDIPALQRWLEIAWMKGFDSSGADYYQWQIYGTRKWIGTTECAALLRSFGVRAMIVSFTASSVDQTVTIVGGLSGSAGGGVGGDEPEEDHERSCTQKRSFDGKKELDADETTESSSPIIDCQDCGESSSPGSTITSLLDHFYELCCNCMKKINLSPDTVQDSEEATDEAVAQADLKSGSNTGVGPEEKDSSECEKAERERGLESDVHWGTKCNSCGVESIRGPRYRSVVTGGSDLFGCSTSREPNGGCTQKDCIAVRNLPAIRLSTGSLSEEAQQVENRNSKAGNGDDESSWQDADKNIHHDHLIQWVWNYFSGGVSEGSTSASPSREQSVMTRNRSPLYFQHRGHSRTIVGIEHRQLSDYSEETNLLVLDPYQRTENLVEALRSKTGWRNLIARDVHTLKQSEYQICYVEPWIAHGEELEDLKVLRSLNYSFSTSKTDHSSGKS